MTLLNVLVVVGGLAGLIAFIILLRRFPRQRVKLIAGATVLAGAAVFAVWWTMFRVDDPTFDADRTRALDSQNAVDKAFGADF